MITRITMVIAYETEKQVASITLRGFDPDGFVCPPVLLLPVTVGKGTLYGAVMATEVKVPTV